MKHKIHTIQTLDQMRKIQIKNMKIIHDDKEKHIDFDKKISSRSFFTICFDWMSKRKKLTIIFWHTNHTNLKKILKKIFIELNMHENFVWIFSIKKKYCNKTDFISRYCVSIRYSVLEHMISFHFHIMNWFSEMIWEIIKCYISNLILELNNEYFIWIQLLNSIIKNTFKFNYIFNSYHM